MLWNSSVKQAESSGGHLYVQFGHRTCTTHRKCSLPGYSRAQDQAQWEGCLVPCRSQNTSISFKACGSKQAGTLGATCTYLQAPSFYNTLRHPKWTSDLPYSSELKDPPASISQVLGLGHGYHTQFMGYWKLNPEFLYSR